MSALSRIPVVALCLLGISGLGSSLALRSSHADDSPVPPPYLVTGSNHVIVGVVWDEKAVRKALPSWVVPAQGMTGAINIYSATGGYGLTPFQSAYFWIDIEGFDSVSGIKGRWMLHGVYGPQEKTVVAMRDWEGFPVRNGTARIESTAEGKRAIGTVDNHDFVSVEIKSTPGACEPGAVTINYLTRKGLVEVPAAGEVCKAEPVLVQVHARPGDPFAEFQPLKTLWAIEFRNGAFSNPHPRPLDRQ